MKYEIWSNVESYITPKCDCPGDDCLVYHAPSHFPMIDGYRSTDHMKKSWEGDPDEKIFAMFFEKTVEAKLEYLFEVFNQDDRPNGKAAHSLSVGDVIVLDSIAYEVLSEGFKKLEQFNPSTL